MATSVPQQSLPTELLGQLIAPYLDRWTLNHLSVTSKAMKQIIDDAVTYPWPDCLFIPMPVPSSSHVTEVIFSPNGETLVYVTTADETRPTIHFWNRTHGPMISIEETSAFELSHVVISPDSTWVAASALDAAADRFMIYGWSMAHPAQHLPYSEQQSPHVVTTTTTTTTEQQQGPMTFAVSDNIWITSLAFLTPKLLAYGDDSLRVRFWNVDTEIDQETNLRCRRVQPTEFELLFHLASLPSHCCLAFGGRREIHLWDYSSPLAITEATITPTAATTATPSPPTPPPTTTRTTNTTHPPTTTVQSLALLVPRERSIVSIRLPKKKSFHAMDFSPDGTLLAVAMSYGEIRIYSNPFRRSNHQSMLDAFPVCLGSFYASSQPVEFVTNLSFSGDGSKLAVALYHGTSSSTNTGPQTPDSKWDIVFWNRKGLTDGSLLLEGTNEGKDQFRPTSVVLSGYSLSYYNNTIAYCNLSGVYLRTISGNGKDS